MELKRVEIMGFKSFPEKIQVEFGKGITAIVGPNGSGKSNISDAVRWVLGEQSAKTLRGAKMEDVIFAGTERRKPVGFAQVTLVLDNHDRKMAVDYEEVAISRRVYRSGESEYTLNGSRCRLRDVQELLMDTGIGKDGYSVIGQGQIDQLLSTKPQDRRMVFEEAAGIVKYKTRKEQAEKQLQEEADHLSRVQDILGELTARLEPLEKQAQTAEQYLALKNELKTYDVAFFLQEYEQLSEQATRLSTQLADLNEQLESARRRQEEAKRKSARLAEEAETARVEMNRLNQARHDMQLRQEAGEGDKRVLQEQIESSKRELALLAQRLADVKEKLHNRVQTVQKEEQKRQELLTQITQGEADYAQFAERLAQKQQDLEALQAAHEEARQRAEVLTEELVKLRSQTERLQVMLEQEMSRQEDLENRRAQLQAQRQTQKQTLQEAIEKRDKLEAEQQTQQTEHASLEGQLEKVKTDIRQAQQKQQELILNMRDLQSRMQWLRGMETEYEGFSGSVKAIMQLKKQNPQQFQAVHGTLADVIQVPTAYALAIEIALGAAIQNIIVDRADDAKDLIEILRRSKKGRATFLPLDFVTERSTFANEAAVKAMPGVIGFGYELVSYAPEYRKIMTRQLGNVVVAEDFDSASQVARRFKNSLRVVTLKGDIFNTGGSITGGSQQSRGHGILSRKGEIDELKRQLEQKRAQGRMVQETLSGYSKTRQEVTAALTQSQERLRTLGELLQQARQECEKQQFLFEHAEQELADTEGNRSEMQLSRKAHEEEAKESRRQLEKLEKEQQKHLEQEQQKRNASLVLSGQIEAEKGQLSQKKLDLGGLRQQQQFLERTMEWEKQEMESLSQEADTILEDTNERQQAQKQAQAEIAAIEQRQEALGRSIDEKEAGLLQMEAQWQAKDREKASSLQEAEEALRIFSALEKEQVRLENQEGRARKDLTDLQDAMWQEYELTYGAARRLWEEQAQPASLGTQSVLKKKIGQIKEAIRALGHVNVEAITELLTLRERIEFLSGQKDDIASAEEKLRELIEQLTRKMEEQFTEGFAAIAESFNQVFQKLFGGGRGILRLAEGENALEAGIEIIAQPPGKKLQSMMLLSGGERALTAISLLFAIQQLNPAPFCILDEIEAALDDANVGRYAQYLKEMSENTQFIIITHRKGTMEVADTMYGVTMEEKGISKCISVQFQA